MLCLFCVSYVCNLVLFIMIGRVLGRTKTNEKKPWNGIVIVVVVVRSLLRTSEKGGEGQKRLLYKAKLCYRDQNRAF